MHHQAINKHLISAHAIVSCTMLVEGQLGKVLAWREDPGSFYGRGKTGPNTDSSRKIKKLGRLGGVGWCQSVVGHMLWGTLSGFPRVAGGCWVIRGCFGGAVVVSVAQWSNACNTCKY
jgi:hypothetical protein